MYELQSVKMFQVRAYFCVGKKDFKKWNKENGSHFEIDKDENCFGMTHCNYDERTIVIYFDKKKALNRDTSGLVGFIAHEVYHTVDFIRELCGEDSSGEFSAYLSQYLSEEIFNKLDELRK